jgi:hypothetical protein
MAEQTSRFGDTRLDEDEVVEEAAVLEGRALETGRFGDATRDPVGSAQQAVQYVRSGEAEGIEIPQPAGAFSPFPDAPGTSAAAEGSYEIAPAGEEGEPREFALDEEGNRIPILNEQGELAQKQLPEMFIGTSGPTDEYKRLLDEQRAIMDDPDRGFWAHAALSQQLMELQQSGRMVERIGTGMGEGMSFGDKALISAAALTMYDPGEVGQMLTQVDPKTGERRWPQFGITHAPDGTMIVSNNINGAQAVVNRPGMSPMDIAQGAGAAAMFTPAGRATGAMTSTAGRMTVGALTAGTTEAIIQQGQEMAGGQFDHLDVALSAGIGPLIDVARPMMGLVQRSGRFIGSYVPENFFGLQTKWQGIQAVIPEYKARVLGFAKDMTSRLQSKRPAIVTTQDAVPEAHTPFRQILLKMVERLPLTGTGGLRTAQREERVETLRWLADRFHLNPNTNYGAQVLDSVNRNAGAAMQSARAGVNSAVDAMQGNDVILRDFRLTIRDMIEAETKLGDLGNKGTIALLDKVRNQIWQGVKTPPGQTFPRGFGTMNDWLEYLYTQSANGPPGARQAIGEVADALRRDLSRHATEEGGEAGARYLASTLEVDQILKEQGSKTLRALIEAGQVDEKVMRTALMSGDDQTVRLLMDNLSPDGVNAARQMVLKDGMRAAGWRRTKAEEALVHPAKFLSWMNKPSVERQLRRLFPDGQDRQMLDGMAEYLKMTEAAGNIGKGVGMAASGGFGQKSLNAMNLVTLGLIGGIGNAYQSGPVRNLLLRLYHVKSDPALKDDIMRQITPLLMAGGRAMAQDWDEDDPHDMVYVSDEFAEEQEMRDQTMINQGMEQLRTAAGAEDEEEGMTAKLLRMIGFGDDEEGEEAAPVMTDEETMEFIRMEQEREE